MICLLECWKSLNHTIFNREWGKFQSNHLWLLRAKVKDKTQVTGWICKNFMKMWISNCSLNGNPTTFNFGGQVPDHENLCKWMWWFPWSKSTVCRSNNQKFIFGHYLLVRILEKVTDHKIFLGWSVKGQIGFIFAKCRSQTSLKVQVTP